MELRDGAQELSDGLHELTEYNEELVDGARQIFQALLDTANSTLKKSKKDFKSLGITLHTLTIENYATEIERL